MANIEFTRKGNSNNNEDYGEILTLLESVHSEKQLIDIFDIGSICLTTPLLYTRLGEDILQRMRVDTSNLYRGMILGKMLEVYARGILSQYGSTTILTSIKLHHIDKGEVDICLPYDRLLCEVTISDKSSQDVHVTEYYKNTPCIRVCATKSKEGFYKGYHRIPYAKLCCMLDTKDILKLEETVIPVLEKSRQFLS